MDPSDPASSTDGNKVRVFPPAPKSAPPPAPKVSIPPPGVPPQINRTNFNSTNPRQPPAIPPVPLKSNPLPPPPSSSPSLPPPPSGGPPPLPSTPSPGSTAPTTSSDVPTKNSYRQSMAIPPKTGSVLMLAKNSPTPPPKNVPAPPPKATPPPPPSNSSPLIPPSASPVPSSPPISPRRQTMLPTNFSNNNPPLPSTPSPLLPPTGNRGTLLPQSNKVAYSNESSSSGTGITDDLKRNFKSAIFSSGRQSVKNPTGFHSPLGPGIISTDTFSEEKICESHRQVDWVNTMMKDIEKRMAKMYQAAQALSTEAQGLSATMKKYAIETETSESVMMKEMGTSLKRLSEVLRYVEVIRDQKTKDESEGNTLNFIDLISNQMKTKKKKLDDVGVASHSLSKKISENMKKKTVNVVKSSEQEKEREELNKQYYKSGPELEAEFEVNSDIVCWKALERFCATAEAHQKFYSQASSACDSIVPDIERSKQRIMDQRSELAERLKGWKGNALETESVDISLKSSDDPRLCLVKAMVAEDRSLHKNLKDLATVYAKDIWTDSTLWTELDKKDVAVIFGGSDVLFNLHSSLLENFESVVREWPSKTLANVKTDSSFGTSYIRYLYRLPQAVQTLTKLRQDSKALQNFFKSCEKKCDNSTDVMSLLTTPCKHMGKYAELYRKYLNEPNNTGEDDSKCTAQMEEFASMDLFMRQIYARSMSSHVQMLLSGVDENDPAWNVREYRLEGTMTASISGSKNDYHFFLFSDVLIYSKKSGDSKKPFKFLGQFKLENITVKDTSLGGDPDSFYIINNETNESNTITPPSVQQKSIWYTQLQSAKIEQNQRRVFGVSLKNLMNTQSEKGRDIPSFIDASLERLMEVGLEKEGIFRLSGNRKDIENCKNMVDSGTEINFKEKDTHCITGFVKMWIRDLPTSLIPNEVWEQIFNDDSIPNLKKIFEGYPDVYERNTLQAVMKVLYYVTLNHEINKMQSGNLSIVFGPLLYRDSSATDLQSVFPLVSKLIDNYESIFSGIEMEREKSTMSGASSLKRDRRKMGIEPKRLSMRENLNISSAEAESLSPGGIDSAGIGLAEIVKQGSLSKKGAKRRNWKERWFVLKPKFLYYFASRKDSVSKGVVTLVNAVVAPSSHKEYCFSISTKDREFLIAAKSESEMKEWIEAVKSCNRTE